MIRRLDFFLETLLLDYYRLHRIEFLGGVEFLGGYSLLSCIVSDEVEATLEVPLKSTEEKFSSLYLVRPQLFLLNIGGGILSVGVFLIIVEVALRLRLLGTSLVDEELFGGSGVGEAGLEGVYFEG